LALENALKGGTPEIFNRDQGSPFTSGDFTDPLLEAGISISMDGRGRCFDNIFIERLWRTVKVEEVYIKDYQTVAEASLGLGLYIAFYNNERFHENLGYRTPAEVFREGVAPPIALRAPSVPRGNTLSVRDECIKKKVISV
jgi:putative transposase